MNADGHGWGGEEPGRGIAIRVRSCTSEVDADA